MQTMTNQKMPSEYDSLLPQHEPSPEISGSSYPKLKHLSPEIIADQEEDEPADPSSSPVSPLTTLIGIFAFVVSIGVLIVLFMASSDSSSIDRPVPNRPGISTRVQKILDETPLIG